MAKKARRSRQAEIDALSAALMLNGKAQDEGRKRKSWNIQDLKDVHPLTRSQEDLFHSWFNDQHICAHGSAGTGKTFLALYLAMNELLTQQQTRVIIIRSAVSTREVGHLPGTLEEKLAAYELPYKDTMYELFGRASTYNDMKDAGMIEFMSTTFLRGLTWDNAVVVVDEGQNMTFHEINTIMTRIGTNTRIIFTGDIKQSDLGMRRGDVSGMAKAIDVFRRMEKFDCIEFNRHDIVRSEFVKSWIVASEED